MTEEQGFENKSSSQIFTAHNVTVEENDRIYRSDNSYEYVNYVKRLEDHVCIRMKMVEGS